MVIAYYRQFTDIPFAAEIAKATDAEATARRMLKEGGASLEDSLHYAAFTEARYKCIVSAIRRLGLRQVLEFGSGLSFRSLAMTHDPEIRYMETDLPEIMKEKRRIIDKIPALRNSLEQNKTLFGAADILSSADIAQVLNQFQKDLPIGIVHEGLLGYMFFEEKEIVANNIREILKTYGGVWITPDLHTRIGMERHDQKDEQAHRSNAAVSKATKRDFYSTAFESEEHISSFFARFGFSARKLPQLDGNYEVTALRRLNLPKDYLDSFDLEYWILELA